MPVIIVDILQAVDIQIGNAERPVRLRLPVDVPDIAVPVVEAGQRVVIAQAHQLPLILRPSQGCHQKIPQRVQQRRYVGDFLRRRVVHPDIPGQLPVLFQRHRHQTGDPLYIQRLIFVGRIVPDGFQILDDNAFLPVEAGPPPVQQPNVQILKILDLRLHPRRAPFMGVGHPLSLDGEQIGPVRRHERAHPIEYPVDSAVDILRLIQHLHAFHDHFIPVQGVLQSDFLVFRFGDVKRDFQAGQPSLPANQLVLEQIMPMCQRVGVLPGIRGFGIQPRVGAEWAGRIPPLQRLIALESLTVLQMKSFPSGGVDEQQIVVLQIGHVNQFWYLVHQIKHGVLLAVPPLARYGSPTALLFSHYTLPFPFLQGGFPYPSKKSKNKRRRSFRSGA